MNENNLIKDFCDLVAKNFMYNLNNKAFKIYCKEVGILPISYVKLYKWYMERLFNE